MSLSNAIFICLRSHLRGAMYLISSSEWKTKTKTTLRPPHKPPHFKHVAPLLDQTGTFFLALIANLPHSDAPETYSPSQKAAKIVHLEKIRRDDTKREY